MSLEEYVRLNKKIDLGIDIGTSRTVLTVPAKGILLDEASMVAYDKKDDTVVATGNNALAIHERIHSGIVTIRPIVKGSIAKYESTIVLLESLLSTVSGSGKIPGINRLVLNTPLYITPVEQQAIYDIAKHLKARQIYLVRSPVAVAVSRGIDPINSSGEMVIDMGSGVTDIAIISAGGIAAGESIPAAGNSLSQGIRDFLRKKHSLIISDTATESLKQSLDLTEEPYSERPVTVRGMNSITGLPEIITIATGHLTKALEPDIRSIVTSVKKQIESLIHKPEIVLHIQDNGIILTGGGSLLKGIDTKISEEVRMPVRVSKNPMTDVIRGIDIIMSDLDTYVPVCTPLQRHESNQAFRLTIKPAST
ncbi:rod shape-determining protein [Prosthecochloris sp. HL-130-GSB]|jgi:rod shape-determining protein MreB and related proteins|uniref:Rod shape-determining protein n=1 Tax=Prosthecochloris aestuarii TaxID=1102 RepID=A0A831WNZ5_PROAE|nr:rod shape-determining protein [Prosthecochloris sp. HL-130-GSB]ARM31790.1 hypothetical protein B9H02_11420 [Prosthecochloris sp. HL-130-GSB]MBO8092395.1 rod shape-determining protein [Prosthecochloris sp.]HED30172.1 rod shape-determining protein [Prosthecochloris aestuarii]